MRKPGDELSELEASGLRRSLRRVESPQGPRIALGDTGEVLNFSSNDYLGLAAAPELAAFFAENAARYGTGSGASRLVCGTMSAHLHLEERLASLKRSESALSFSSGFAAALGTIPAVCGKDDFVILDKLCHASLVDGARLSGATIRVFPHNDLEKLDSHLRWAGARAGKESRILVVTESIFSMDGDLAPLSEIVALKERYDALLLVDEAHAFGAFGPEGRGFAADKGLEERIEFQMGTLSKAIGLAGGYVCTSRDWTDLLANRARSFVYSTAPSPALAATAREALDLVTGPAGDRLRKKLRRNIDLLAASSSSAILPVVLGESEAALEASTRLLKAGFLVPAIRFPTVPRGTARLRITVSAAHREEDITTLRSALTDLGLQC